MSWLLTILFRVTSNMWKMTVISVALAFILSGRFSGCETVKKCNLMPDIIWLAVRRAPSYYGRGVPGCKGPEAGGVVAGGCFLVDRRAGWGSPYPAGEPSAAAAVTGWRHHTPRLPGCGRNQHSGALFSLIIYVLAHLKSFIGIFTLYMRSITPVMFEFSIFPGHIKCILWHTHHIYWIYQRNLDML